MANTKLKDYPAAIAGGKQIVVLDHDGPASYPTGGEVFSARQCGLKTIDSIQAGLSSDLADYVWPVITVKGSRPSVKLFWVVVATGAEVANAVDLSTKFVRLTVIGN